MTHYLVKWRLIVRLSIYKFQYFKSKIITRSHYFKITRKEAFCWSEF